MWYSQKYKLYPVPVLSVVESYHYKESSILFKGEIKFKIK
jgi:hypothetical protein